jgi:transcriptional regulator with XRE-family HTH domain
MGESLGGRIQALRREAGLTQVQLAERSGLSFPNLRNWETGHRTPGVFALFKIARALGRSVDDFLDGVDEDASEGGAGAPRGRPRRAQDDAVARGKAEGPAAGAKGRAGRGKGRKGKG